jgi:hypothetical protein
MATKSPEVEIGQGYQVHPVQRLGVPYGDDNKAQSQPQREHESTPEPKAMHAAGITQRGVGIQRLGEQHGAYQEKRQPLTGNDEAPSTLPNHEIHGYTNENVKRYKDN